MVNIKKCVLGQEKSFLSLDSQITQIIMCQSLSEESFFLFFEINCISYDLNFSTNKNSLIIPCIEI